MTIWDQLERLTRKGVRLPSTPVEWEHLSLVVDRAIARGRELEGEVRELRDWAAQLHMSRGKPRMTNQSVDDAWEKNR